MKSSHQILATRFTRTALSTWSLKGSRLCESHFTTCCFISNREKKLRIHRVKSLRIQTAIESDVKEADIHCLPTTPVPHVFPLRFPFTHQCTEMLFFLFLQHAKRQIFSWPVAKINIPGTNISMWNIYKKSTVSIEYTQYTQLYKKTV